MLIILGLLVLSIIFFFIAVKTDYRYEAINIVSTLVGVVCILFFIGLTVTFSIEYCYKDANTASYQQQYESLTYQLENIDTLYANSRANDRKQLYDQIQKWNQTVAEGRVVHNSLWTSWFQPIDFNKFEFIELK